MLTGRFPWGAGFYDMSFDTDHTTANFTIWPEALRNAGYATAAVGKWDAGYAALNSTATYRGFESWFGYYEAAQNHYWRVSAALASPPLPSPCRASPHPPLPAPPTSPALPPSLRLQVPPGGGGLPRQHHRQLHGLQ